mgnify:FL=1
MLITVFSVFCAAAAFVAFNRKNRFAYLIAIQYGLIALLVFVGMLYISKVGQYAFPLRRDYDIYRLLYRVRMGINAISRIYNLLFALVFIMCVMCTRFASRMSTVKTAVLCLPALLFVIWTDSDTQLRLYIMANSANASGTVRLLYEKGNRIFEWIAVAYLLLPVAASVAAAIKTRIYVKRKDLLTYSFCFCVTGLLIVYLFIAGVFRVIWFKNVNVSKMPLAPVRINGYLDSVIVIVFVIAILVGIFAYFRPYNIFRDAHPQYQVAKRLYNNLNMLLHVYKNVFLIIGQQMNLIKKGLEINDLNMIDRVSDLSLETVEEYMELNTKLLRLMKNNVGACETVNIADCVRRAIEFTDAESKAELNVDFGCGDIAVWGVSGYITEVFVNIIRNAVDATRDTGRKPAIGISVISENDCCMVEVSDNGGGIAKSELKKIFEPFYTTKKANGSGLGLYYVKTIIRKHNGDIRVLSKVGKYTKMQMFFPVINR